MCCAYCMWQIRAELAEKELILLQKEQELLDKEQTLMVLKEEVGHRRCRSLLYAWSLYQSADGAFAANAFDLNNCYHASVHWCSRMEA